MRQLRSPVANQALRTGSCPCADDGRCSDQKGCDGEQCALQNSASGAVLYESPYDIIPIDKISQKRSCNNHLVKQHWVAFFELGCAHVENLGAWLGVANVKQQY